MGRLCYVKEGSIVSNVIPVNEPLLVGNEKKYLAECIDTGWISSEGPFVKRFESEFSARMGRKHGIAVTNGTAAVDVAVEALGIGAGDEVILPTFAIISCVLQIVRSGATPVLVDSDPLTWNMDVAQVESKITPRTKAILVVHTYGLPVNMDPIMDICSRYGLKLIEDAAEMIGQTYKGRPCGSFGDISTVSFYPNKHITTGEGGMVLTGNDFLADTCRDLRNLCFRPGRRFVHERLGWNLRMTNLQAAVGCAQLENLDKFVDKKRWIGRRYGEFLANLLTVQKPLLQTDYATNIFWVYGVVMNESFKFNADTAIERLAEQGVGCRPFFYPLHKQPVLLELGLFKGETYPVAERLSQRGFYLPSGLALTHEKIEQVSSSLYRVLTQ
jgi:perosamine synthetase